MNIQTGFIAFLSLLWIAGGSWYVGNLASDASADLAPLELRNGEMAFSSQDHFEFGLSSAKLGIGTSTRAFFADVATFLKKNEDKAVVLDGLYLAEELNQTAYINLGEARATAVMELMVKLGAPKERIKITSQTLAINPMRNEILYDGVGMKIIDAREVVNSEFDPTDDSAVLAVEYVEPMTLFGDAVTSLENNPSMQHYIEKISAYLTEHEEAKLQIIGHTEELGSVVKNKDRSREMANRVKRFFRNNGINYKRLDPQSRGATEPILAPNSPNAAEKNNRVEIRIIE